jgi:hypothetical protein
MDPEAGPARCAAFFAGVQANKDQAAQDTQRQEFAEAWERQIGKGKSEKGCTEQQTWEQLATEIPAALPPSASQASGAMAPQARMTLERAAKEALDRLRATVALQRPLQCLNYGTL